VTHAGAPNPPPDTAPVAPPVAPPSPLPVLPLEYEPPTPGSRRSRVWRRIATVCLILAWPLCAIAVALVAWETESVVATGPLLFVLGILILLGGLFTRDHLAAAIGAAHCAICILFFVLVNALNWSPNDAHTPFLVMGTIYTLAVAFPTVLAFLKSGSATAAPSRAP
jgi:hypothetical protein